MIPQKVMQTKDNKTDIRAKKNEDNVSRETLININQIEPNKSQPRRNFNEDSLHELADSIKLYGIIQPLILQKRDKYYEIIAGERRWRAAKVAGLKEVPAIVKDYSSQEIVEIALIENIQREDLNPIEEAIAFQKLINEYKLKQDEVAERVSKSRTAIANSMRLLKLDQRVQQMLIDDMISSGHARALITLEDGEIQYQIATKIFDEKLSVRETEKLVKKLLEPVKQEEQDKGKDLSFIYHDIEEKIKEIIGSKVQVKQKTEDKGKIEIEYYSKDEFERIIELFQTIKKNQR
ncbi:MAG: ParB/RepB/Spo0J family partition protein [Clostridiales bacterium]|nr:ParB/RepB/Spo0J family partition protein [uncultured Anaerosporobacter sp.]MBS5933414.1 ParB/RepB/Spo0J family partition protein [Clostridiales bacterium]